MTKQAAHGLKVVGASNWLAPDPVALVTSGVAPGYVSDAAALVDVGSFFVDRFTSIELGSGVSGDCRRLFAVACGAVTYSVFYYPLLELGLDRSYTALEVAVGEACEKVGGKRKLRGHHDRIDFLCDVHVLGPDYCDRLHILRELRNSAKHSRQSIIPPGIAARELRDVAALLTALSEIVVPLGPHEIRKSHDHVTRSWK